MKCPRLRQIRHVFAEDSLHSLGFGPVLLRKPGRCETFSDHRETSAARRCGSEHDFYVMKKYDISTTMDDLGRFTMMIFTLPFW